MIFDIGGHMCGFEGLFKQYNGLNSICNKMYALAIQNFSLCSAQTDLTDIF